MLLDMMGLPEDKFMSFPAFSSENSDNLPQVPAKSVQVGGLWNSDTSDYSSKENAEILTLHNVGLALGANLEIEEILWVLYKESRSLIDTSNFAIALYNEQKNRLDFSLVFDQGRRVKPFQVKCSESPGLASHILTTQAPLLVEDPHQSGTLVETEHLSSQPTTSWLGVPLHHPEVPDKVALGVMMTWAYESVILTDRHLWLLSALGMQAAVAIRRARLLEINKRQTNLVNLTNKLAYLLTMLQPLEDVLDQMMRQLEDLLDVETGWLLLSDSSTGDLVLRSGLGDTKNRKPFRVRPGQGIAGQVALTGQPRILTAVDAQTRNVLGVPLKLHEQVVGVLVVMNKKRGNFTQDDLILLNTMALYTTLAIEKARLQENIFVEQDRLIDLEDQIRQEVARDLHDGPVQRVSSMMMRADFCQKLLSEDPTLLPGEITTIKQLGQEAIHQMRTLLVELRPLELEQHGQGLVAALRVFLERRQREVRTTRLSLTCQPQERLSRQDAQVEKTIFTVVQETVNNALKHAQAQEIRVEVHEAPAMIKTIILDNGRGFDVEQMMSNYNQKGSLGMLNIRERAEATGGELRIESKPDQGTRITLLVPKAKADRMRKRSTGQLRLPPGMGQPSED